LLNLQPAATGDFPGTSLHSPVKQAVLRA
jgi:hypothetical protein